MIKTVSLETAKLLKEAGFKQKGEFYYLIDSPLYEPDVVWFKEQLNWSKLVDRKYYLAPTTDELLEELPTGVRIEQWTIFSVSFFRYDKAPAPLFENESLPEALAEMWLWLKKERLI